MSHLYKNKRAGWQIKYRVFFEDGSHQDKTKFKKNKYLAQLVFKEASELESLSRKKELSKDHIIFFLNRKYINQDDARKLAPDNINTVRNLEYDWEFLFNYYKNTYIEAMKSDITKSIHISRTENVIKYFKKIPPVYLTPSAIDRYVTYRREQNVDPSMIDKDIDILKGILEFLVEKRVVPINPALLV